MSFLFGGSCRAERPWPGGSSFHNMYMYIYIYIYIYTQHVYIILYYIIAFYIILHVNCYVYNLFDDILDN